ncbi:MAG: START domain-containing protein [Pseudomonadota bacterium]
MFKRAALNTLITATALSLCGPAAAHHDATEWEVKRDRDGIVISTRSVEGSRHKMVRSEMTIPARLSAIVALLQDTEACKQLSELCRESRVLSGTPPTDLVVYTYNDLPWPVTDRVGVVRALWSQDPANGIVTMEAEIVPGHIEKENRTIRLENGTIVWRLTPLADGMVEVVQDSHVDPAGRTPAWLTNRLLVDAPFETLVAVREILASGRYAQSSYAFIDDELIASELMGGSTDADDNR